MFADSVLQAARSLFSCFWCLPLLGEACLEACEGFLWEGSLPAHWWVELDLGPLVGRAMSRGMSRGDCGLRKSLGNLPVDGWGCVPGLLVVWPEAFQHWRLQAVLLGPDVGTNDPSRCLPQEEFMQLSTSQYLATSVHMPSVSHSWPQPP